LGSSCILCNVLDVFVLTPIVLFDAMCYLVALVILDPNRKSKTSRKIDLKSGREK
jgi:hypothetical protein